MNWFLWFLVAWFLLGAITTVTQVGKPRKPLSGEAAAFTLLFTALLIAGVFVFGAHR